MLGAAIALSGVWIGRVSVLTHRPGTFRARVGATPTGPWKPGLAQYSTDQLTWWRWFSLGGAQHWERTTLTLAERVPSTSVFDAHGAPYLAVTCTVAGQYERLYLLLDSSAYAGFASWLEATSRPRNSVI